MSLTLGEKLRQAREERGVSISEVAEQTRISPLYIESIENDDYRNLPGGIFNKGFVKSFAKYVGVNEQEAMTDYGHLIAAKEGATVDDVKTYRPEVLTDDRSYSSSVPTIIVAVIILSLMTAGVLFLVNYLRKPSEPVPANVAVKTNTNTESGPTAEAPVSAPDVSSLRVDVKAATKLTLISTVDGEAPKKNDMDPGAVVTFEPKDRLVLNYLRWNAENVSLTINGKTIEAPKAPTDNPKAQRIEFTISKENLSQILSSGSIVPSSGTTSTQGPNSALASPASAPPARPTPPPARVPSPTPKPATTPAAVPKPASNVPARPKPTP
jgi:cytoskeletal protein RodZ